ncbi:MAG: cytochrome P450 [Jatrophihabitans sp.]|uniref:cytochrome P450 n=1 Tax=Jatrophihabitans sp. TaxID=1932789 RepID=UPI00391350ED
MGGAPSAPLRYDPYDPAALEDPYAAYRELRDSDPVHLHTGRYGDGDFYVLSRFEDIWAAVRRADLFSSAQGITFRNERSALGLAPTLVMLDPPVHTGLRALIGSAFTPKRAARLEGELREFVRGRIAEMERRAADGEPVDLHRDFSSPVPTFVLGSLLGIPDSDRSRLDPWVAGLTRLQNAGFAVNGVGDAVASVAEMYAYFSDVVAARRAEPRDDLLGALVAADINGERLTDWDILGFCFVMVAGGNDTTGNLISHGVMLLDQDHAARERLAADPALIPNALVEFLRLESSVQGLARMTTAPVTVRDVKIPEGVKVLMLYGSGNRDEREFGADADRLDLTRDIKRHLAFSSGAHFCIGSHFARLQARVAFEELYARQPHVGVDVPAGRRLHSSFTRGWISLPATGVEPAGFRKP